MKNRGFEKITPNAPLPLHGSKTAAGYDFYAPIDVVIPPQSEISFDTDIKAYMKENEMLVMVVRSSMGIKHGLMISNTVGIIDSDYYNNPSNEGNIRIALRNIRPDMRLLGFTSATLQDGTDISIPKIEDLRELNTVYIPAGERVVQGIFVQALRADDIPTGSLRTGGVGSTG